MIYDYLRCGKLTFLLRHGICCSCHLTPETPPDNGVPFWSNEQVTFLFSCNDKTCRHSLQRRDRVGPDNRGQPVAEPAGTRDHERLCRPPVRVGGYDRRRLRRDDLCRGRRWPETWPRRGFHPETDRLTAPDRWFRQRRARSRRKWRLRFPATLSHPWPRVARQSGTDCRSIPPAPGRATGALGAVLSRHSSAPAVRRRHRSSLR